MTEAINARDDAVEIMRDGLTRIANHSGGTQYSTIHGMRGIAKDVLDALPTNASDAAKREGTVMQVDARTRAFARMAEADAARCTCITELQDDAYEPGGPMSGRQRSAPVTAHGARQEIRMTEVNPAGQETRALTPERYVAEFIAHGEISRVPLLPWEKAYQNAGMIEAAERAGYLWIGRDVACTIELTSPGRKVGEMQAEIDRLTALADEAATKEPEVKP